MSEKLCKCGKLAHPLYGDKCEDCWVGNDIGSQYDPVINQPKKGVTLGAIPPHICRVKGGYRVLPKPEDEGE
mgnify:CR=1 FL=1